MNCIKLTLESDLCVASGESGGNSVDSDICIDTYGLPYIPARRIKGCLRYAAEELHKMGYQKASESNIRDLFGDPYGKEGALMLMDGTLEGIDEIKDLLRKIRIDKSNPTLKRAVHPVNIERLFSEVYGSTKMQDGVKVDNTLRFTRVLRQYDPLKENEEKLSFTFPVYLNDKNLEDLLSACCKAMRHIGLNRNRGLGDVRAEFCPGVPVDKEISVLENRLKELCLSIDQCKAGESIIIKYFVSLEEPVSIPGLEEYETAIPGRSMIGCMSGAYLMDHRIDDNFKNLFLNGTVTWSFLTPVIEKNISAPAPFMLLKLKNGGGRMINRFTQPDTLWTSQKPKALDGSYAVVTKSGYAVADPILHMYYHHSIQKEQLYLQSALEAGMVYGGRVEVRDGNKELAKEVIRLLLTSKLGFGRSKGAQYAACKIKNVQIERINENSFLQPDKGTPLFVILESDLIINENGVYITQNDDVREHIAKALASYEGKAITANSIKYIISSPKFSDSCHYKTIGGFHNMWQLQKPHIPAVKAGSVYCFVSPGTKIPRTLKLGEYVQEGFGSCRIYTLNELNSLQDIQKSHIDRTGTDEISDRASELKTAMRIMLAKDALRRYAREYRIKDSNVPVSRLRLMLSEADSFMDLCKIVGTMKTSDKSSINEKGKKKISEDLLLNFYGPANADPLVKILKSDPGLFEELESDNKAMEEVRKLWKLPLDQLLHNMHYTKGK